MLNRLGKKFWKLVQPGKVNALEARIQELSPAGRKSWYYFIDFGYGVTIRPELKDDPHSGMKNWSGFLSKHLPDVKGKRVLDIGCNAGLYDLKLVDAGAAEAVGIDFDTQQAEFVRQWFAGKKNQDYSNVHYIAADATRFAFSELGHFDIALILKVAYHFGEGIEHVMGELQHNVDTIVMQGNTPRLTDPKYADRSHQHLAGVEGMQELLKRFGYTEIRVIALEGHIAPLVIGSRQSFSD